MINLAPWRYRRVLAVDGGPVERIESRLITVFGEPQYQATAYLKQGLRREAAAKVLYSSADGCGTDRFPTLARHKAISESLERWAHAAHAPARREYGFDVDPSSNGMAAFPGVFGRQARERAWAEAVERQAIMAWWTEAAEAAPRQSRWGGIEAFEIESADPTYKIALLHAGAGQRSHAYGHAAGRTFEEAADRARIELARAQFVVGRHERLRSETNPADATGLFERRCLFFAGTEGHALFRDRMSRRKTRTLKPRVIFNGEITGPWSDYACVWRAVFEPVSDQFLSNRNDFFFW